MQREQLRKRCQEKLGDILPYRSQLSDNKSETHGGVRIEKFVMTGDRQIRVPVLLLIPSHTTDQKLPVTIIVAETGKDRLLKERAEVIAALLEKGVAVCLPDLRGSGETESGRGRSRQSEATSLSATEFMLGQTLLGSRLKDLRSLLSCLRHRNPLDSERLAVWGDSLAEVNTEDRNLKVPYGADPVPNQAEPSGPLLALLAGLYEEDLAAVVLARGGLIGWQSLLKSPFLYVPHDAVIPGALTVGDVNDIAGALAPKPLWISGLVDGLNRQVKAEAVEKAYAEARKQYRMSGCQEALQIHASEAAFASDLIPWLLKTFEQ